MGTGLFDRCVTGLRFATRRGVRAACCVLVLVAACAGAVPPEPEPPAPLPVVRDAGEQASADAGGATEADAGAADAGPADAPDAGPADAGPADAGPPGCEWAGAPGTCLTTSACSAIADRTAETSSQCTTGLFCCIDTPNVADNPPVPAGWKLMQQAQVTQAMTDWAVAILHDPITYPMYSTTTRTFGSLLVLARVEWHAPDFQNGVVHRGVTLYVPA